MAASAVTAGSGLSAGAIRTKASSSSATTRGYGGGGDPLDRHQSTDEEDRDLDLSGDNDRDLDLDEHPTQVTTPPPPPPPPSPSLPLPPDCITSSVFSSSSGGESKTQTRPTRQLSQQWSPRHTYRGNQQGSSSVVQPSRQCTDHHQHD